MIRATIAYDVELDEGMSLADLESLASDAYSTLLVDDGVQAVTLIPIRMHNALTAGSADDGIVDAEDLLT